MDLIASLRHVAFARPHLLVVPAPGATGIRIAVERLARQQRWRVVGAPADADVLVEAGRLTGGLADAADLVACQLGEPCVRVALHDEQQVESRLDEARRLLGSGGCRRDPGPEVAEPPMAERGDDRDGLALDVLRVPFGPVLSHWPAGLRLALDVQGDVAQSCHVDRLGITGAEPFWASAQRPARPLDRAARLLATAGWAAMAERCRVLRDRALAGPDNGFAGDVTGVAKRIRRSRLLRALLTGIAATPDAGDTWQRLMAWLAEASVPGRAPAAMPTSVEWLDRLPELVAGQELSTVRLIVAGIDIDLAEAADRAGAAHG